MTEGKAPLTNRLRKEGRWDEASAWKDSEIKRLRSGGMPRAEAREAAWEAMAGKYPPLESPSDDEADLPDDAESQAEREQFDAVTASMEGLPNSADIAIETDWISAHPALLRYDYSSPRPVWLTPEDVLAAPHGRAPSCRAVVSLQHFCNNPSGLHRTLLQMYRAQRADRPAKTSGEVFDDTSELKRILQQYGGE